MKIKPYIPYAPRSLIRKTRNTIYLFEDASQGGAFIGQAAECIGEPNCYPIYTKHLPCKSCLAYFTDNQYDGNVKLIEGCLSRLPEKITALWYPPQIGQQWAMLPQKAPQTYKYLLARLTEIAQAIG